MQTKNQKLKTKSYQLTIGWLYPDLMSTYGDRGNVIVLTKRCEWRNIKVSVEKIFIDTKPQVLSTCDLFFMGGAQDMQQEIVNRDLFEKKGLFLSEKINEGVPGLFICGAYQFLGKYYLTAEDKKLPGLGLLPVYTENPGEHVNRLIGNITVQPTNSYQLPANSYIVGFENHGGRTYLEAGAEPFAKVIKGFGNNGKDGTEGLLYKNAIGSYLHGPILPKNPHLADWLIERAILTKYKEKIKLKSLDSSLEEKAKKVIIERYMR